MLSAQECLQASFTLHKLTCLEVAQARMAVAVAGGADLHISDGVEVLALRCGDVFITQRLQPLQLKPHMVGHDEVHLAQKRADDCTW